MITAYRRDTESFNKWANANNWILLEIKDYSQDDGTMLYNFLTPNGIHVAVTAKENIVIKVTPWDGSVSSII